MDCVSGYVSALLKLAGGFCCWHGTLLEWSMPRACVEGQSASQGGGQRNSGRRHCLLVSAGMFLGIRSDIEDCMFRPSLRQFGALGPFWP